MVDQNRIRDTLVDFKDSPGMVFLVLVLILVLLCIIWLKVRRHEESAAIGASTQKDVTPTSLWTVLSIFLSFAGTSLASYALIQVNRSLDLSFRQKEIQIYEYLAAQMEAHDRLLYGDPRLFPYLKGQRPVDLLTLRDHFPTNKEAQLKAKAVRICEQLLDRMQHQLYQARWMPDDFPLENMRLSNESLFEGCPLLVRVMRDQHFSRSMGAATLLGIDFKITWKSLGSGRIEFDKEEYEQWWRALPVFERRFLLADSLPSSAPNAAWNPSETR